MPYKLLFLAGVSLCTGCTIFTTGTKNLIHEPINFIEAQHLSHACRHKAKEAWLQFSAEHPEWCDGDDFRIGFLDGYADYLDNGGKGEPPAIPPQRYRKNKYLNPEGFQAIDRYFAGFASGSQAAIASGLRDTLLVPVLVPDASHSSPVPSYTSPPPSATLPMPSVPPMSPTLKPIVSKPSR
jgi:hypothetical protein